MNISVAYIQSQQVFVADKVFPLVPVLKQSDLYWVYSKADFLRIQAQRRAPGAESAGSGYRVSTGGPYFCDIYALHKDIDDPTRANTDSPLDMDRDATLWLTQQMLMRRESDFINNYFTTGIWGTNLTGVAATPNANQFIQWNQAGSTPIEDITNQMMAIESNSGFLPNTLLLGPNVYQSLRNNAELIDRIKYTPAADQKERGIVTPGIIANVLDIERVFVARAVYNAAAENLADVTNFMAGNGALLCYSAPAPSLMQPSAGYIFSWNGLEGAGAYGMRITNFRMEWLKSDRVESEMSYGMASIAPSLGTFFANAHS